jgi:hypothetical protein
MPLRSFALAFLCLLTWALWVGGFTFYSAAVIPVLHDRMDSIYAGAITQRVTDSLNCVGVAAVAVWWFAALARRSAGPRRFRRIGLGLLAATTVLLVFLIVLHRVMDHQLESDSLGGFYPLHRTYLIASTVQWFLNLGLLAVAVVGWRGGLLQTNSKIASGPTAR